MTPPEAIVIGCSLGGFDALRTVLGGLDGDLPAAVIVCCHAGSDNDVALASELFAMHCALPVREARERHPIRAGQVHLAPGGYHLLLEAERRFALSVDPVVQFARPSIDVLFESAASLYGTACVGVVLTGANADGAGGLHRIRLAGGIAVVQQPAGAMASTMPQAALDLAGADHCLALDQIASLLNRLCLP